MYKRSIEDPAGFWSEIAAQFYWKKRWSPDVYSENIDVRKGPVKIEVGVVFLIEKCKFCAQFSGPISSVESCSVFSE